MLLVGNSASARLSAERVVMRGAATGVRTAAADEDPPPARLPDEPAIPLPEATGGTGVDDVGGLPDSGLGLSGWLELACQLRLGQWLESVGAEAGGLVCSDARFAAGEGASLARDGLAGIGAEGAAASVSRPGEPSAALRDTSGPESNGSGDASRAKPWLARGSE
jgi:hypothetical protein